MKVADAPITLLADAGRGEITMLAAGLRVIMTGEEARLLWTELGDSLKTLYPDPLERSPKLAALLRRESAAVAESVNGERSHPVDRVLEGIIAYAHKSGVPSEEPPPVPKPVFDEQEAAEASRPSAGVLGRAIGRLTGR